MSPERVTRLHRILTEPWAYELVLGVSGAAAGRREFFRHQAHLPRGARVLEIGCGHGRNVDYLPEGIEYTGCDSNPKYIEHARRRYGDRARFECVAAEDFSGQRLGTFDVVLVVSVLHHLDDDQVVAMAEGARAALDPRGRLLVWEPCWVPGQRWLDRLMLSLDRGRFVRTADGYAALLRRSFQKVDHRFLMTPKMLWPQSGCILTAAP